MEIAMPYTQQQYLQVIKWYFLQQKIPVVKTPVDDKDKLIDTDNNTVVDVNGDAILADPT
jgi:hypothetical protein